MKKRILGLMLSILLIVCALAPLNVFAEKDCGGKESTSVARLDLQALLDLLCEKWGICLGGNAQGKDNGCKDGKCSEDVNKSADRSSDEASKNDAQNVQKNDASDKNEAVEESADTYEREVVRLVNIERAKYGLSALTYSKELSDGAREKSLDMQKNRYFSHTSPTYGSPFDQMKARGISYRSAGENIAMGYKTPAAVVAAWMNSEGHRANILSSKYTGIGVGYVAAGNYWTQWFIG